MVICASADGIQHHQTQLLWSDGVEQGPHLSHKPSLAP
jgi:hypothetical protein